MSGRYPYSLRQLYTKLNARFWGGQLPQAVKGAPVLGGPAKERGVLVRRVGGRWESARGVVPGRTCFNTGLFIPPRDDRPAEIHVVSHLQIGAAKERLSLLHEMVHCALWFAGMPHADADHGPRFVAELEAAGG